MTPAVPQPYRLRARNLAPDSDNKIHDDDVARRFGFSGALVPGVEVFAYAVHPFVEAWGTAFLRAGALAVRFRRPVYDAETIDVVPQPADDGTWALQVVGGDGEPRAVGTARGPGEAPVPADVLVAVGLPDTDPADPLPAATPESLAPGTVLGTVREIAHPDGCGDYLEGIAETSPLYAEEGLVHPGLLLRMVNASLFRSVALGPWIHTASDCRFLGLAAVGSTLTSRAVVTGLSSRNGHEIVEFDAVVDADSAPALAVRHTAIYSLGG